MPDGGGDDPGSVSSPSDTCGATSPWRGRIEEARRSKSVLMPTPRSVTPDWFRGPRFPERDSGVVRNGGYRNKDLLSEAEGSGMRGEGTTSLLVLLRRQEPRIKQDSDHDFWAPTCAGEQGRSPGSRRILPPRHETAVLHTPIRHT